MSYFQIGQDGAVTEQDGERHRYLLDKGVHTFDSLNELIETLREKQGKRNWMPNERY